jgi:hypothetical protein
METRRDFLRQTGLLLAGLSSAPFAPATSTNAERACSAFTLEVAHVLFELKLFEQRYLPALLDRRTLKQRTAIWGPKRADSPSASLARWKWAIRQLRRAVPRHRQSRSALDRETLQYVCVAVPGCDALLKDQPPACAAQQEDGRICWRVYPYSAEGVAEREEHVRRVLRRVEVGDPHAAEPWRELRRVLPAVKERLRAAPPAFDAALGAPFSVLPILAELDPAFVLQALDRGWIRAAIEGNQALTPEERTWQRRLLGSSIFPSLQCHSLTLILEALANNHFPRMGRFLAVPEIHADSHWNGLMPKILYATLHRKVAVLRDWTQGIPPSAFGRDGGGIEQ